MLSIHISTPHHKIIHASDIGEIKAALSLCKANNATDYTHVNLDQPERTAKVVKWGRYQGEVVTIKKPDCKSGLNN